jgi:transposase InsO family protein
MAVGILDAIGARMPFGVRAISVDNGSEFLADFEAACAARGIALLTLPPRSPKLNGSVERANRTHTEESDEVTDAEVSLAGLQPALLEWEVTGRVHALDPYRHRALSSPGAFGSPAV